MNALMNLADKILLSQGFYYWCLVAMLMKEILYKKNKGIKYGDTTNDRSLMHQKDAAERECE